MSEDKRSFWASVPGLITGLAGLLTGIVGLGTLAVQQGILGKDSPRPTTTVVGAGSGIGAPPTTEAGAFTLTPLTLDFPLGSKSQDVTVKNISTTAAITMLPPRVTGDDDARFVAAFGTCNNAPLPPGASCTVKVTFSPAGILRRYNARLQIQATGAPRTAEVSLSGTTLVG